MASLKQVARHSPQIIAAQRRRSMAPQMAISTTTIFQCFFAKRCVGIIHVLSVFVRGGSVTNLLRFSELIYVIPGRVIATLNGRQCRVHCQTVLSKSGCRPSVAIPVTRDIFRRVKRESAHYFLVILNIETLYVILRMGHHCK